MTFQACLPIVLRFEGGFVDDPQDPGGATNLGVTLATLSSWLGRTATIGEVEALTADQVGPIYLARYYNPAHACDCPAGVDLMVFDEAVNQGVGRAILSLQRCAGVTPDGAFGPQTRAAVTAMRPAALIDALAADREAHYRALPTFAHFGKGWLARLAAAKASALGMAARPPSPAARERATSA